MTPDAQNNHARFCEHQFALELIRRIRDWKCAGKSEKR